MDHCLSPFHAFKMPRKQDPDVELPLRKTQSHADQCKIDLCNKQTFSLTRESAATTHAFFCVCLFFDCEQEKAHYQSTTGTISSSGWFPTT